MVKNESVDSNHYDREGFQREVSILKTVLSPFVVPCIQFCDHEFYMKKADASLQQDMERRVKVNVLLLAKHITEGLYHLKLHGLFHGDVHPGHILRFGSKYVLCSFRGKRGERDYMCPELLEDKSRCAQPSSDMWSFAVVVWQVVCCSMRGIVHPPMGDSSTDESALRCIKDVLAHGGDLVSADVCKCNLDCLFHANCEIIAMVVGTLRYHPESRLTAWRALAILNAPPVERVVTGDNGKRTKYVNQVVELMQPGHWANQHWLTHTAVCYVDRLLNDSTDYWELSNDAVKLAKYVAFAETTPAKLELLLSKDAFPTAGAVMVQIQQFTSLPCERLVHMLGFGIFTKTLLHNVDASHFKDPSPRAYIQDALSLALCGCEEGADPARMDHWHNCIALNTLQPRNPEVVDYSEEPKSECGVNISRFPWEKER